MNYNFSDILNRTLFLNFNNQNKSKESQFLLLLISTALRQSLAVYELQWKSTQNLNVSPIHQNTPPNQPPNQIPKVEKKAQEKHFDKEQQNKNLIDQLSYKQPIIPKQQQSPLSEIKPTFCLPNNHCDEHKQIRTACQYPQIKKIKVIHQNHNKQQNHFRRMNSIKILSFIDLYEPAYIPKNHFSINQIRQKREKLLERRVFDWKQIDKKVGFRKMQLKKLLT